MAALDWSDAEMWLEGAVQSGWSVSRMRRTRWESQGRDPEQEPVESQVVSAEADDGFVPLEESDAIESDRELDDQFGSTGPLAEGPDFGEGETEDDGSSAEKDEYEDFEPEIAQAKSVSPFAALPTLPDDIAEAMEQFKIAIVRHRAAGWQDISPEGVRQVLGALSEFADSNG